MAYEFGTIEKKWQTYWLENRAFRALDPTEAGDRPKAYVLDMFPYPSGDGLHVGHVIQQTATDILCRHLRAKGVNVLHPMGWDAFGLPAEEYARKHNVHPAISTKKNIDTFRRQIQALGMGYDWEREVNTTDPAYYKWTQWIFLQLFNSYYDRATDKARPIAHLINELQNENLLVAPDGTCVVNPNQEGLGSDQRRHARRAQVDRAERRRTAADHRRPSPRVHGRGDGELVSGSGHGAGERGSDRRQERARRISRRTPSAAAVADAHHRVQRPTDQRPRCAGVAGESEGDAAELDR